MAFHRFFAAAARSLNLLTWPVLKLVVEEIESIEELFLKHFEKLGIELFLPIATVDAAELGGDDELWLDVGIDDAVLLPNKDWVFPGVETEEDAAGAVTLPIGPCS